jgi:hypothetical protein
MTDCRIQMGDGSGIAVDNGSPKVSDCILEKNGRNGIAVTGSNAHPILVRSRCRSNEQDGILFLQAASGDVQNNVCESNGRNGIVAGGLGTTLLLRGNACNANGQDGIEFGDEATWNPGSREGRRLQIDFQHLQKQFGVWDIVRFWVVGSAHGKSIIRQSKRRMPGH